MLWTDASTHVNAKHKKHLLIASGCFHASLKFISMMKNTSIKQGSLEFVRKMINYFSEIRNCFEFIVL